ncbi:MAG: hypothetical protein H6684_02360 [Deltaproteobacteria bacterium]|nr:hypothetical protein [Deltaproteobacteria bacterium]
MAAVEKAVEKKESSPKAAAAVPPLDEETTKSRLYLRCALPLAKVVREDNAAFYDKLLFMFKGVVQLGVKGDDSLYTQFIFNNGEMGIAFGRNPDAALTLEFPTKAAFNGFMAGKMGPQYLFVPKPFYRLDALIRVLPMLLALKILDPNNIPTDPKKQAVKVKLTLYMITSALSQLNRCRNPKMVDWTKNQPDRIYQWTVQEGGPAAYLRIKAGKTKSGRGVYKRKSPFVHMLFPDIKSAFMVLTNQAPLVEAVAKGFVVTEGAMEYSKDIGGFMQTIEAMLK